MRGYFAIGSERISKPMNLGALMRTANAFGASFVFSVGAEPKLKVAYKADTSKTFESVPYYQWDAIADALADLLEQANPGFAARAATLGGIAVAPDADAMVSDTASFRIVDCPHCGGMLKPDIVYFGESVPKARVDQAYSLVDAADALLVAGSSLTVYSGFRFVRHAAAKGMPIAIINRGPTRGDDLADVKIDNGCSPMLALLADELPALNVDRRTSAKELNAS